ncbi:MAG: hypothetical protein FWC11_05215 [Firmicutes bacterium]|nr:hypothetical protein [Bacillota bacterium]MCL2255860.1 hypothetical protein [Bacillota bacterium]MCL2256242.1 hypothetical protein [Bacillota bacterium]
MNIETWYDYCINYAKSRTTKLFAWNCNTINEDGSVTRGEDSEREYLIGEMNEIFI